MYLSNLESLFHETKTFCLGGVGGDREVRVSTCVTYATLYCNDSYDGDNYGSTYYNNNNYNDDNDNNSNNKTINNTPSNDNIFPHLFFLLVYLCVHLSVYTHTLL